MAGRGGRAGPEQGHPARVRQKGPHLPRRRPGVVMNETFERDIFFSFFMFTADLKPEDSRYTRVLVDHLKALTDMGYDGFDVHIASQPATVDHHLEVESYAGL